MPTTPTFSPLLVLLAAIPLARGQPASPGIALVGDAALVTSTCNAHFNTPCSVQAVNSVVDSVAGQLRVASNPLLQFDEIQAGNSDVPFGFWPTVLDDSCLVFATGRMPKEALDENGSPDPRRGVTDAVSGLPLYGSEAIIGRSFEQVESEEAGLLQTGLCERIKSAAEGDGYFHHLSHDLYPGHGREPPDYHATTSDVVSRIGVVRKVVLTSDQTNVISDWVTSTFCADCLPPAHLYVISSFSDKPNTEPAANTQCNWKYDTLCSLAYTRKVLGKVMTAMIVAHDQAALQELFASVTFRMFNEEQGLEESTGENRGAGFYPFIYQVNGTNVAHGANPSNVGRTLPDIIAGVEALRVTIDGVALNSEFAQAAYAGGGWVGYLWRNPGSDLSAQPYTKIAFVTGVRRLGVTYYIGVGFNHQQLPAKRGPHCATCLQDFNYPCAWANAQSLVGHVQSMLFMEATYTLEQALGQATFSPEYGGNASVTNGGLSSKHWLCRFIHTTH